MIIDFCFLEFGYCVLDVGFRIFRFWILYFLIMEYGLWFFGFRILELLTFDVVSCILYFWICWFLYFQFCIFGFWILELVFLIFGLMEFWNLDFLSRICIFDSVLWTLDFDFHIFLGFRFCFFNFWMVGYLEF